MGAQQLADDEHQVGGGAALRQRPMESHADHLGQGLIERLAQQDRLGLDAAHAVAQDAQAADHGGVRVGAYQRVGEGHGLALGILAQADHVTQELQVHLVDDAGARRHDAEIAQRRLCPAQQLVALTVALVLALDVEGERLRGAEAIDLHAVVDDEAGRHQWVDACGVATQLGHGIAHGRQVDHGRYAGEVLQQHASRHEGDLDVTRTTGLPRSECGHVRGAGGTRCTSSARGAVAQHVLQQHLDGEGESVQPIADRVEAVDGDVATSGEMQAGTGGVRGGRGHRCHEASSIQRARRARSRCRLLTGVPASGRSIVIV